MQNDYTTYDISALQTQFELKSLEFDQALKKDKELSELKKIFHEMRELHTRIADLRHRNRMQAH
jgi:hypothetical protein